MKDLRTYLPLVVLWAKKHHDHIQEHGTELNEEGMEMARSVGVAEPERIRIPGYTASPRDVHGGVDEDGVIPVVGQRRPMKKGSVHHHDRVGRHRFQRIIDRLILRQIDNSTANFAASVRPQRDQHVCTKRLEVVCVLVVAESRRPTLSIPVGAPVMKAVHCHMKCRTPLRCNSIHQPSRTGGLTRSRHPVDRHP